MQKIKTQKLPNNQIIKKIIIVMKIMILVGSADSESHSLSLGRNIKEELNNLSQQVLKVVLN